MFQNPIYDDYKADKMAFVGDGFTNQEAFHEGLGRLNAVVGNERGGDIHVVAIRDRLVGREESQSYTNALVAYWQSKLYYDKLSLAKNAIVVVLGVDDTFTKVTWSRAKTGIPIGNNALLTQLEKLRGQDFTPEALFGHPTLKEINGRDTTFNHSNGAIEKAVLVDPGFDRLCMESCKKGQQGNFVYLNTQLMLTSAQKWKIFMVNLLVAALLWAFFAWLPWSGRFERLEGRLRSVLSSRFRTNLNIDPINQSGEKNLSAEFKGRF